MPAQKTFADINFVGKFATRQRLDDPVSSDPSLSGAGDESRTWYNTTTHLWKYYNGTAAIDPLNRTNHSSTQTASTISDLATVVQAYSLSSFAAITADLSLATHKLTNVLDPVSTQDAATKNYVDQSVSGVVGGLILKGAVTCAATTNISITSAPTTVDGVTMSAGMVVLLTNQTTTTQNGPYVWASSGAAMARATNWATSAEAVLGSFWIIEQGTNADNTAICSNTSAITIGTTTPTFVFKGAGTTYTQGNGINITGAVVSAVGGTGILTGGGTIVPDFSIVGRKVQGIVPTTTTGIVTVTGAVLTINHALSNYAPSVTIAAYSAAISGYTTGDIVISGATATDANNVSVTLPVAPVANAWYYSVIG
jgi:hypothetical protein